MNSRTKVIQIDGVIGLMEMSIDLPDELKANPEFAVRGLALVAHPHPLMGGTMDNKVAQTMARAFNQLGYVSVRPNFRGVGGTAGVHDNGVGELEDLLHVTDWMRTPSSWAQFEATANQSWVANANTLPLVVSGFSFGSFVGSHLVQRLAELGRPAERLVMIGSAAGKWTLASVPADTLAIHGELDETIPLTDVLDWARPQELTVQVVPGADHFFHRRLHCIRNIITSAWLGMPDHRKN
ncbi:alpha/beta hydrolase [Polynucleobacter asymbioticus]|jgi:alpha/beta superfamily hydrolase|uniref:Hydrolase of the alpha/beta superfamily n=2 Tax=Polynucleobacter asymbioticus TaxID=576611 RepID=A4T0B2_POLAQ|nr:alpha/beta hydrolase [Polynucleobacter asymbioticus]ABP35176.1 hydrolase of the alpha/beta superfamily [Polynucleobacter asymbioticus QLW-P1DMWA-1]APB99831.1 alpha/beta hydrolase [Polynucleobacter asymbioticus]APC02128.1 alpha/beta hydrolase [Polynucleobacter asymbioticus]APC06938.1 alpha/beta hydrolase [Polynucleobacter asymbioticus]